MMTNLSNWLRGELQQRGLTQAAAAVYAGVAQATISGILIKGHIPKVETLFRLADYFGTPREEVVRIAGHLPPLLANGSPEPEPHDDDGYLIEDLLKEFRRVPDEWKEEALAQVRMFARLARRLPVRYAGEDELAGMEDGEEREKEEAA
jgi:transcriptional regulator with XRE-family HTH domain